MSETLLTTAAPRTTGEVSTAMLALSGFRRPERRPLDPTPTHTWWNR